MADYQIITGTSKDDLTTNVVAFITANPQYRATGNPLFMGGAWTQGVAGDTFADVPYETAIAKNLVTGKRVVRIYGENPDIDNAREDITNLGDFVKLPADGGVRMQVVSSAATDANGNTGVQKVKIRYLKADYTEAEEEVTMNGVTPVLTVAVDILRINYFHTSQVGSGGVASGDITLQNIGGTVNYSRISTGLNTMMQCFYTVPLNKQLVLKSWRIGSGSPTGGAFVQFLLRATAQDNNGVSTFTKDLFQIWDLVNVQDNQAYLPLEVPYVFPAKTDIKVSAISDKATSNAQCSAVIRGYLESI